MVASIAIKVAFYLLKFENAAAPCEKIWDETQHQLLELCIRINNVWNRCYLCIIDYTRVQLTFLNEYSAIHSNWSTTWWYGFRSQSLSSGLEGLYTLRKLHSTIALTATPNSWISLHLFIDIKRKRWQMLWDVIARALEGTLQPTCRQRDWLV